MNVYVHRGRGHYIGSVVVCIAKNEEQARQMARKFLDDHGLPGEKVEFEAVKGYEPGIVYAQDGDY